MAYEFHNAWKLWNFLKDVEISNKTIEMSGRMGEGQNLILKILMVCVG